MARQKKGSTLAEQIASHIEEKFQQAMTVIGEQLGTEIPELVARSLGVATGDDAIAAHVSKIVDRAKAKKGPGRPKGSKNVAAAPSTDAPKRRGRPPGSKNKATLVAAGEIKKGPGRPKGSKNAPKATTVQASAIKKGPGRPKKNPEATAAPVKKGPGRPKKAAVQAAPAEGTKRRGRPPGSKNKPKEGQAAAPSAPAAKSNGRNPGMIAAMKARLNASKTQPSAN